MPENADNPLSFFQELKRRKVVRVIIVYAAASLAILEFVSIIEEPLGLPDWTVTLILVLLSIGLIITIILSWIYDIHPEGRIVKTDPAHEIIEKVPEKPSTVNAWKIATAISVVVIVVLIIFNIFGRREIVEDIAILDKSIAVLPFVSLSDDPEKQYLADGTMDAILLHLSKIKDLRVMARTSVEQYRETDKTATAICQELDVAYLLVGSFQKYGDQVRIIVQLITPEKEDHIWANEYNRNWTDIFSVQSEVAQAIARELQAIITPEEQQLIERVATTSLTAYDFYQRGKDEHLRYQLGIANIEALETAENLYYKSLEYDSSFAQAYTGLAFVYWYKHSGETYYSENFLDSALILAEIALSFNDQLSEAYLIRGDYYREHNKKEQALSEYDKAIRCNPNEWRAYSNKASLYSADDFIKMIDNYHIAISLHRGSFLPGLYSSLSHQYAFVGFKEKAIFYAKEALKLDDDSASYYSSLADWEFNIGNYDKSIEFGRKSYSMDSTDWRTIYILGLIHIWVGRYAEGLEFFKKYELIFEPFNNPWPAPFVRIGHAYWVNGFKDEAEYYFNIALERYDQLFELGRIFTPENKFMYYQVAALYAILGNESQAYVNLMKLNQLQMIPNFMIANIKDDPMFDNIRDEPEFQQIIRDFEAKYQAEHERVRKWLEENEML